MFVGLYKQNITDQTDPRLVEKTLIFQNLLNKTRGKFKLPKISADVNKIELPGWF